MLGADIFIETTRPMEQFGSHMDDIASQHSLALKLISCRGVKVYPMEHSIQPDVIDVVRCRFVETNGQELSNQKIRGLLQAIEPYDRWMHVEKLQSFDGISGYSKAHGED